MWPSAGKDSTRRADYERPSGLAAANMSGLGGPGVTSAAEGGARAPRRGTA